jgi:HK97 gp10 family phage protein
VLRTEISRKDLNNILGKLNTLSKKMRKDLEFTINKHALRIESDAKSRVVVDTGRLRSSIKTEKLGKLGRTVYTNVKYAPYVEFGTKGNVETEIMGQDYSKVAIQFKTSTDSIGGVRARPFLFPAFETERPRIIKALKDLVQSGGRL